MSDVAIQNIVGTAVLARLRSISSSLIKLSHRNCILVPDFYHIPAKWTNELLQVKQPSVYPYGMGGGAYLQKVTVSFALFVRCNADPKGEHDAQLTKLDEKAYLCRRYLTDFSAGSLQINLYDSEQLMSARPYVIASDGSFDKEIVWTTWTSWGMFAQELEDVKLEPGD